MNSSVKRTLSTPCLAKQRLAKQRLAKQRGAALLIMMTIMVVVFVSVFVSQLGNVSPSLNRSAHNISVLASAKSALLSYALLSDRIAGSLGVGYLPCPDADGDGLSNAPCGSIGESAEGWLPWQTLGIKPLKDASFTCLRYAVSGNYKINPASTLNSASPSAGHFIIHDSNNTIRVGNSSADYALAVIFAPGGTHTGQSRTLGGGAPTQCGSATIGAAKNNAGNYLDTLSGVNNSSGTYSGPGAAGAQALPTSNPSVFIQADAQDGFNDVLTWVALQDYDRVYARMP